MVKDVESEEIGFEWRIRNTKSGSVSFAEKKQQLNVRFAIKFLINVCVKCGCDKD